MNCRNVLPRSLTEISSRQRWHTWFPRNSTSFEKVLRRESLTITEHFQIDDSDIIFHLKQWQDSDDSILSDLSRRFVGRRLFKAIDLDMLSDERPDFIEAARAVVIRSGFAP